MIRFKTTHLITLCLLLFIFAAPAQSQQQSPWSFTIDGGGAHQSESDLKDATGGFSVDRWFLGAGLNYSRDFRTSIGASITSANT